MAINDFDTLQEITVEQLVKSADADKVKHLASIILGKDQEVTIEEAVDIFNLEVRTFPANFSVSRGEKRPPASYLMNDYHLSFSFNAYNACLYILRKALEAEDVAKRYFVLKGLLYKIITSKMNSHEAQLAKLINQMKAKDGLS